MTRPAKGELLRAGALALAAVLCCWPLTTATGLFFAAVGAMAGALAGAAAARTRVRTWAVLLGCAAVAAAGGLLAGLAVGPPLLPRLLGPLRARTLGEATLWLALALAVAAGLRLLSVRHRTFALAEASALAAAVALRVAAHRDGMIHRPLALGDWAFSRGRDPVSVFVALGALGALAGFCLLLAEPRRARRPVHLFGLLAAVLAVVAILRLSGGPQPREPEGLGTTGEPREQQQRTSRSGGGGSPSPAPSGALQGGGPGGTQPQPPGSTAQAEGNEGGPPSAQPASTSDEGLPFRDEYPSQGGDAPVAVVLFRADYAPPAGYYYFRQTAFSQWNGIRLVEATRADVDRDVLDRFPPEREDLGDPPPRSEARSELRTTVGLLAEHPRPFALDAPLALGPAPNADPGRFRRTYEVLSSAPTFAFEKLLGLRAGRPEWTAAQWAHYTDFPRQDPRYAELGRTIVAALPAERRDDPFARALAVKIWLEKNGTYSRKSHHAEAPDPTASFLFGDRVGYCVHFAHASAFLMRSVGLPARVGGGYAVEESRRGGGSSLLVRGLDAHAWPEVYLEGAGWVIVDVSPEKTLDEPPPPADPALQRRLAERLRGDPGEREAQQRGEKRGGGLGLGAGASWLVLALLLATYAAKAWRRLAPAFAASPAVYRLAYRAALDQLGEAGLTRGHGESRERFAARVLGQAPSLQPLTLLHLAPALGSRQPLPGPAEGRRLLREVGRELARTVPAWRRALGLLNPVSFLWTR